jgi:hypothetical protein
MRPRNLHLRAAAATALTAISLASALPASAVRRGTGVGQAVQLQLPIDAVRGASSQLSAVDCAGKRWCLAGGGYSGRNYRSFAMTAAESGGHWGRASEVRLPAAVLQAAVTSVDCTAVRSCVVVGNYLTRSEYGTFSVTESAGRWARPQIIAPPPGGGNPGLAAVSCSAPGSCQAVGSYEKGQGYEPITATESHGVWARERALRLPAGGYVGELESVSCPRRGLCVAAGDYDFNVSDFGVMVAVDSKERWQRAAAIQLPVGARPGPFAPDLSSLSCTGVGSCAAVGTYENAAGLQVPMMAIDSDGRWSRARTVDARPANAGRRQDATFGAVSCIKVGTCLTLGSYHTKSGRPETMFVTLVQGQRPRASELRLPPNGKAGGEFDAMLFFDDAVDCTPMAFCAAVGAYKPRLGRFQAWMATTSR